MRKWVFVFFIFNFLLLVVSISGLPREAFDLSLFHGALMAFVLILLSFWVWKDGEHIEDLLVKNEYLLKRIVELEKPKSE